MQTSHINWLMERIRPLQAKNTLHIQDSIISTHYLAQMDFTLLKEKQHLITLLKLLVFVRGLNYIPGQLTAKYRCYNFLLRSFVKYIKKEMNQYQLEKTRKFLFLNLSVTDIIDCWFPSLKCECHQI